jgi:hypothetical protein
MQALLDAWVVGGSPSRPQSTGAGARRPTNERAPTGTPRGEMIRPADADKRAPPTWLERLSESTLVKDTWLDRNLVKPLSENASVGSSISSDISGSRTARAAPGAAEGVRSGEREARRGGREGHAQERPASAASPYDHRSGAMTDRYGGFGDRRGAAAPERGGRDLVEHLRELESSLARPAARDREYGRSSASESWRTADRHRETVPERDGQRQRAGERGGRPALEASALSSSAVLASRLASPRDVRHSDTLAYREVVASPRGPPTQHEAKSLSRAGLLASPRVPKGMSASPAPRLHARETDVEQSSRIPMIRCARSHLFYPSRPRSKQGTEETSWPLAKAVRCWATTNTMTTQTNLHLTVSPNSRP